MKRYQCIGFPQTGYHVETVYPTAMMWIVPGTYRDDPDFGRDEMTPTQIQMIEHIGQIAKNAVAELGNRANRGTRARPTVQELNNTIDRLTSIINLTDKVLA